MLQLGGGLFGHHNFGAGNDGFRNAGFRLLAFDARGYGASDMFSIARADRGP